MFRRGDMFRTMVAYVGAAMVLGTVSFVIYEGQAEGPTRSGSSGEGRVLNAARGLGLRDVRVLQGTPWMECGKDDSAFSSAYVEGTNVQGERVRAVVCCGPFEGFSKGCTLRW